MNEEKLHALLPIGDKEKLLLVVRHHWFAYVSVYVGTGLICLLIAAAVILVSLGRAQLGLSAGAAGSIVGIGMLIIAVVILFSLIPVWIKKQEMLVLTEEALLQVEKPSLFANKVSQLNLQHIADVTVKQDTLGTLFGFGHITIETPGEQDNYEFSVVGTPREYAKQIIEAHENYAAALESGQIQTTLGQRPPVPGTAWRPEPPMPPVQQSDNQVQEYNQQNWQQPVDQPYQPQNDGAESRQQSSESDDNSTIPTPPEQG